MFLSFPRHLEIVRRELAASPQRYVVSDLQGAGLTRVEALAERPGQPLALPPAFPPPLARCFPWNEPVVFRAGRYLVHRVTGPVQKLLLQAPPRTPAGAVSA
jgi:hypothetical protein